LKKEGESSIENLLIDSSYESDKLLSKHEYVSGTTFISEKYGSAQRPEWLTILQEELKRLPIGKILFNPPEVMKLGVEDRVEARISRDINTNLRASLKGRGTPKTEEIKISELMKVRLSGSDFNIIPLNEEE